MAKTKISEFSSTPANNTDIDGINIAEGCAPSGINDAIRELMSQLKDWQAGLSGDVTVVAAGGTGVGTLTGIVKGNGTSAMTAVTAPSGTIVGTTDAQTLTSKTFTGYTETVYALSGTAIDPANGTIQTKTLGANTTFTESLADGQSVVLMLNPVTYTVTWPTMTWINTLGSGASPTLEASSTNVVVIWQVGATVYGNWAGSA